MKLVDTHCHLQAEAFDADRAEVLERSLETLAGAVVIGDTLEASRAGLALAAWPVRAAVGVHPYHAAAVTPDALGELRAMAAEPGVAALGEIGLDYYKYNDTPREVQQTAFHAQLALAAELGLPVVIHNREASDDVAAIIEEHADALAGGVMHCFAGPPAFAERCLSWGFHISFTGNVTFPKAQGVRDAAAVVPLDRLMVETDCPYLAPQRVRGRRCEPGHVRYTAEALAEVKGVSFETLAAETTRNAARFFGAPWNGAAPGA